MRNKKFIKESFFVHGAFFFDPTVIGCINVQDIAICFERSFGQRNVVQNYLLAGMGCLTTVLPHIAVPAIPFFFRIAPSFGMLGSLRCVISVACKMTNLSFIESIRYIEGRARPHSFDMPQFPAYPQF